MYNFMVMTMQYVVKVTVDKVVSHRSTVKVQLFCWPLVEKIRNMARFLGHCTVAYDPTILSSWLYYYIIILTDKLNGNDG